ncbi:MAG: Prophage regulatory [Devosia sp.]|uniref:helix-turn-helix transcriptional regulator n=1 Tax=Devosia sp. TaxID=1871048 RepID=UPI00263322DD|nr:AlpA family phage regulatory protein [Devosia sp.]MDB5528123.1 Prophage regulatory [Devosia sp.]
MKTCIEPTCLPPPIALPPTGFLRQSVVLDLIPWSKSTLWNRVAAGQFPHPVPLGPRLVGWRVEAVVAYIQSPTDWEAANA